MEEYILEMQGICKGFYGINVLKEVEFGVKPGEVHILLGENGAGKSTLMKILSGVYHAEKGSIKWQGSEVEIKGPSHSLSMGIGMVYQELSVVPEMTVVENIWLGNLPKTSSGFIKWKEAKEKTQQLFDDLQIPIDINARAADYDLGIRQLIEIFRVVSKNVKLIILDEPTSSLTDVEVKKLFETIKKLKKQGVSFIYITHKLEEVFEIGDRVTVLRDGSSIGNTLEEMDNVKEEQLVSLMVGRDINEQHPKEYNMQSEVIMDIKDLSDDKNFFDVSIQLHRGEVLGVAGLVGSGRSELAKALFGAGKITKGSVKLYGEEYKPTAAKVAIRKKIGFITKDRKDGLLLHMPVSINVTISKKTNVVKQGFRIIKKELEETKHYIEQLKIDTSSPLKKVRDLSGGNQQKVAVARWMCCGTEIYIMDEPTRGVDVGARIEIYNLMNEITKNGGAILMISSDMPELLGMSDNIVVMKRGKTSAFLDVKECTQELIFEKAAGGETV